MGKKGIKIVSPRHRPPLAPPPGDILVRGFVDLMAIVRQEGLSQPAAFWLVAQGLGYKPRREPVQDGSLV
jgi:hypothetical protein